MTEEDAARADDAVRAALAAALAEERAAVVATLIRVTGDWELAEDCLQDATERALARWPRDGIPDRPAAWLNTVARHRARDVLRRRQNERAKVEQVVVMDELARPAAPGADALADDRLRLVFTCCHPALALESRVALTLKVVAGLDTRTIADAFLTTQPALSQRLLRAKRRIANAAIPYRVPGDDLLAERTEGVLAVVYLVFNAGYSSPDGALAGEAVRLARLLVELLPADDEVRGLLALLCFSAARLPTRFDAAGDLVPMEQQDRRRWDRALVAEGRWHLRRAARNDRAPGTYRLQAAIAHAHVSAPDAAATDWAAIVAAYDALLVAQPSPIVALNRAIAIGFGDGPDAGLAALAEVEARPDLPSYYVVAATRADFLRRAGHRVEAAAAYRQAVDLAPTAAEVRALRRRLDEVT